nr:hypothetical protein [Zoogloeaceae bacterium]
MKPVSPAHTHPVGPPTHIHPTRGTTLTQGVGRRLLVAAPALALLWLSVLWALQ